MKCKQVMQLISRHIDGELDPVSENKMCQHIEHCATCRHEKEMMLAVSRMLTSPESIEPSTEFGQNLDRALNLPSTAGSGFHRLFFYLRPAAAFTVCILFAIGSFILGSSFGKKFQGKTQPARAEIISSIDNTMDLSIFDDIPRETCASVYLDIINNAVVTGSGDNSPREIPFNSPDSPEKVTGGSNQ